MKITIHKTAFLVLLIAALFFFTGCATRAARLPPAMPEAVTIERKDGLTELLGDGNRIFARYITYKRDYVAEDIIPSPDYLQGRIIAREIEICFENPKAEVRVIKKLKDDKEFKDIYLISRFKYNPQKNLLAFTPERRGTIFVISTKTGKFIKKIVSAAQPRWSADGNKLFYTATDDEQEKEVEFLP